MHFGFALELPDIDLWNIDLLHKHLDLLSPDKYTDTPSKYFLCFHNIFKTSSRYVLQTSSRLLQRNNFCLPRRLGRRKIVTLKTSWTRYQDMSWRHLKDVFKTNNCLLGLNFKKKIDGIVVCMICHICAGEKHPQETWRHMQ